MSFSKISLVMARTTGAIWVLVRLTISFTFFVLISWMKMAVCQVSVRVFHLSSQSESVAFSLRLLTQVFDRGTWGPGPIVSIVLPKLASSLARSLPV